MPTVKLRKLASLRVQGALSTFLHLGGNPFKDKLIYVLTSQKFKNEGQDVAVYVSSKVSVNGKPYKTLINPDVDIASVEWDAFNHSNWILPSKED